MRNEPRKIQIVSYDIALMLWLVLGFFGGHKFYLRQYFLGAIYFLTLGGFGVAWLIDIFTLHIQVDRFNKRVDSAINKIEDTAYWQLMTSEIIRIASLNHGIVKVLWVYSSFPMLDTKVINKRLEKFHAEGYCTMEVDENGGIYWEFRDLKPVAGKI